jgi:hypothetical protein
MQGPEKKIEIASEIPKGVSIRQGEGIRIRTPSQGPTAMEASFTCDSCQGTTIVKIPWDATAADRSKKMKTALDEHRRLCPVGLPEEMRTYRIYYPR